MAGVMTSISSRPMRPPLPGVGIQTADRHRFGQAQSAHERVRQQQTIEHGLMSDQTRHVGQGRMGGDQAHAQDRAAKVHAVAFRTRAQAFGQELRVAGEIEPGGLKHGLVQRTGKQPMGLAGEQETHGPFQTESGGATSSHRGLARGHVQPGQFRRLEEIKPRTPGPGGGIIQAFVEGVAQARQGTLRADEDHRALGRDGGEETPDQLRAQAPGIAQGQTDGLGHGKDHPCVKATAARGGRVRDRLQPRPSR